MEWQPIETAPDKERILVWTRGHVVIASKRTTKRFGAKWSADMDDDYNNYFDDDKPTKWMPLPE